ncbi:MAG TPA: O-antigen ligase [Gemmatimonadales bacterium]|nr:O-antigen ligase [Gemmatimonadales bacterium]
MPIVTTPAHVARPSGLRRRALPTGVPSEPQDRPGGVAALFVVLALLLYSGAARPVLELMGAGAAGGRARVISWPIYLILSVLALSHAGDFIRAAWRGKAALLFGAFAVASVAWSTVPSVTARRGLSLVMATLLGLYFVVRFNERERLRMVCWTLGAAAVLSLIVGTVAPSIGRMPDDASWRGVFIHKNVLGKTMALSVGAFLLLAQDRGRRRWLALAGAGVSFVLLLLSRSVSALLIGVTIAAVTPLLRSVRLSHVRHLGILIAAVIVAEAIVLGVYFEWESMLTLLGRDPTLTGRTDLWLEVLGLIQRRPWLGYGLGGFWLGWEGESAAVWSALGWRPPHAHNGLLDITLDLGMVGLALFLAGYVAAWTKALWAARSASSLNGLWALMFLTFLVLSETTESALLAQNSLMWVLYVATVAGLIPSDRIASTPSRLHGALGPLSLGVRRRLGQRGRTQPGPGQ